LACVISRRALNLAEHHHGALFVVLPPGADAHILTAIKISDDGAVSLFKGGMPVWHP
jgi:hypothetical protein